MDEMYLFTAKGDDALELIADMIDPVMELANDDDALALSRAGNRMGFIKYVLKEHKEAIFTILALCDKGVQLTDYELPNTVEVMLKLVNIFGHPDVSRLFFTADTTTEKDSGNATESTVGSEN